MISWFNSWAQGIILAVIIVTILEMIVPEGKNKKYIKIVMGVYITFTIISPIISKAVGSDFNIDLNKYENLLNQNTEITDTNIGDINDKNIEDLYLTTIKNNIKKELEEEGYKAKNIDITANINIQKEETEIYKIDIKDVSKLNNNEIKKVNKIEIGKNAPTENENNFLSSSEIKNIKEILSNKYEVDEKKIYVNGN